MKQSLFYAAGLLLLAACSQTPKQNYVVTFNADPQLNDQTAYIVDFDTEDKIDSAVITDGIAVFQGELTAPRYVTISVDGRGAGRLILEGDSITVNTDGSVIGGELNAKNSEFMESYMATIKEFRALPDSLQEARYPEYNERITNAENKLMEENIDNPLGYAVFLSGPGSSYTLTELDSVLAAHPSLGEYNRVQKLRQSLVNLDETSEGKMFKDFEVTYNDSTFRLSDYVGKGKYVLVDFWASWCGPCIRQTAVIKDLYKEYGPKGLEVIGVAVWDKPEDTLKGIEAHELPWMNVINAQSIPTDLYGIKGIPCIILFGPDGTILSRGKQSDELRADVSKAMADAK
ncbi:MAG: AhpC/TSA family protein [Duncaniella sp.]|uniref:TlpA disulfide reductase family protein n=1 Tax=Duncaniella sp. TaxID=2518496 RepID=UPI0023BCE29A|nr:TlpA disulfide reductase family protein [Duncaniella sp.]MDE6090435.1 AhpC/TSA family protein [Duncaniella sp.]